MCYYNTQKVSRTELIKLITLEKAVANYDFLNKELIDGFSYGNSAVLKPNADKTDFDIVEMEWGFIPSYWKNREEVKKSRFGYVNSSGKWTQYITLNAIAEELLLPKKMYRDAALQRRCLVLSTGFFDWRHIFPANKRTGLPVKTAVKYPYHIRAGEREYFYMAGIWQPWTDTETGEHVETFSIVTTKANALMSQVHNSKMRMPTILTEELAFEWLMDDLSEERIMQIATTQYHAHNMSAYSIDKEFKNSEDPTAAFEYEELPALVLT